MDDFFRHIGHCPSCKARLDAHAVAADRRAHLHVGGDPIPPQPGEFSVCGYCSVILCFTEDGGLRLAGAEELTLLPPEMRLSLEVASAIARRFQAFRRATNN